MKQRCKLFDGTEPFGVERQSNHQFELDTETSGFIGDKLRSEFSDVLKQPLPERFLVLIRQLELGQQAG